MSHNLLALASEANEASIAFRTLDVNEDIDAAAERLVAATDALTGAVVEHVNDAAIEVPLESLTRLREVEELAARLGKTIPEAIVWLVNERLSGGFHDGYNNGYDDAINRDAL